MWHSNNVFYYTLKAKFVTLMFKKSPVGKSCSLLFSLSLVFLSLFLFVFLFHSLSLSLSFIFSLSLFHSLFLSLSLFHSLFLSLSLFHSLFLSHSFSPLFSLSLSLYLHSRSRGSLLCAVFGTGMACPGDSGGGFVARSTAAGAAAELTGVLSSGVTFRDEDGEDAHPMCGVSEHRGLTPDGTFQLARATNSALSMHNGTCHHQNTT